VSAPEPPPATPLDDTAFAALMAPLGPFEGRPVLAAAVSGGADSMALCLLAHDWARARDGRVAALVVDHGLRSNSAEEAAEVVRRLSALGVEATPLRWENPRRDADVQASARRARYRLMSRWCREAGVLHLLLAHHRDDQAETFLIRLGHSSGLDGLAAMAPIRETNSLRILRPLLPVDPARLRAVLKERGQSWIEDPSNRDPGFERVRIRRLLPALGREGVTAARLARTARALGRARAVVEAAVARHLADCATVHPAGYCLLDRARWLEAPEEISRRALLRVLLCVGGGTYPPRGDRLARLWQALADEGGEAMAARTLAGCRVLVGSGRVLVCREAGAATGETALDAGRPEAWDGRFMVCAPDQRRAPAGLTVRRLGEAGWAAAAAAHPGPRDAGIPAAVRPGLPAMYGLDGLVAVPHLKFVRADIGTAEFPDFRAEFRPVQPLAAPAFALPGGEG
jgi:tRNA(Ile)-lysidine synthase